MFNNQKTVIMKRFIRTLFFCTTICAMSFTAMAQVTIGSAAPPASFALLELCTSNVKSGLRLPQLGKDDAAALRAQAADAVKAGGETRVEGLMFYNSYTGCVEYWSGEKQMWRYLCGEESVNALLERITKLTEEVTILEERVEYLENFTNVSDVVSWTGRNTFLPHPTRQRQGLPHNAGGGRTGLGVSMISTGATYIFWGTGRTTINLSNNTRYYLLASGDTDNLENGISRVLSWHQGEPTISTVWLQYGDRAEFLPLYIDDTGIYIQTTNNLNLGSDVTVRFSKTVILANPDSQLNQ